MYDNVCSLPLQADLFALAIHPTTPILFVGLASGHVEAYRLPSDSDQISVPNLTPAHDTASTKPGLLHRRSDGSDTPSESGVGTITSLWKTRRHKGSCRALSLSRDGKILYSAGTDGLLKAARADSGVVTSKVAIPRASKDDGPASLLYLNPQALLLGTDEGRVHLFELSKGAEIISSKATKVFRPHTTKEEPENVETITSLASLPPTGASTSGASRQFVSTAGSTLAVTDVHRGTISVSVDQGDLLLSTIVKSAPVQARPQGTKRKAGGQETKPTTQDRVLVGTDAGVVSLWERGKPRDYVGMVAVNREMADDDGGTIDCLAVAPGSEGSSARGTIAAGLGSGAVRLFELQNKEGKVVEEVMHDDQGFEGVTAVGFEIEGRLISGGGQIVKVWVDNGLEGIQSAQLESSQDEVDSSDDDDDKESGSEDDEGHLPMLTRTKVIDEDDTDDEEDSEDEDVEVQEKEDESSEEERKRKKRKRGQGSSFKKGNNSHGITAFSGLD